MAYQIADTHENCITFAQIIRLFTGAGEPDAAVLGHITSCPRCYRMFSQLIYAAQVPAVELLPEADMEISAEAHRAEGLLHDYLYEYLEVPELLAEAAEIAAGLSAAEKEYLGTFIDFLGAGASSPKRAEKARASLAGTVEIVQAEKGEGINEDNVTVVDFSNLTQPEIEFERIAAAKDDDATIKAKYTLANKWELTALYQKGEPKQLTLKGAAKPHPVLEWAALPSLEAYKAKEKLAMTFSKLTFVLEEGGCPVYFLPGEQRHVVGVPTENGVEYFSLGIYDDVR
jgi:hypothetical protein